MTVAQPLSDAALEQVRELARPLADKAIPELEAALRELHAKPPEPRELDERPLTSRQLATLLVDQVRLLQLRRITASPTNLAELRSRLDGLEGRRVAVLSGAGISVDSGVPTFRGASAAGRGLWERVDPMELASIEGFRRNPERTLAWYSWRRSLGLDTVPSLAHTTVAAAEEHAPDRWAGVHTQNVDGLHEAAGSRDVRRIHGSIWCWRDRETGELLVDVETAPDDIPRRPDGTPRWRPGVVMFGDYAPVGVYERAVAQLARAEVALVVGTAAQVTTFWPLLEAAYDAGARFVEVNPKPSDVTEHLGAVPVQLPAGVGVPLVLETLGVLPPETTERLARTPSPSLRERLPSFTSELLSDDA